MSDAKGETIDEWADALEAWRKEYWDVFNQGCDAWRKRGEDEAKMRRLKKEYDSAVSAFQASDVDAQKLRKRLDDLRATGDKRGFRT